jgi:multicomponent Na+:H+ antiporter subunit C
MLLIGSIFIGILSAIACYLIMQRSFVYILFGFVLLSNAVNLVVLTMSGSPAGRIEPVVLDTGEIISMADPLPQALVLTAIVIGFGMLSYLVFLLYRIFTDWKTTDILILFKRQDKESS